MNRPNQAAVSAGQPSQQEQILWKGRRPAIRRSDQEWLQLFKEQQESNLTLLEFCQPRGLSYSSFSAKRTTLMKKYHISSFDGFDVDRVVHLKGKIDMSQSNTDGPASGNQVRYIRVIVDGHVTVEIPAGLDPSWVAELIYQLRQDCNR